MPVYKAGKSKGPSSSHPLKHLHTAQCEVIDTTDLFSFTVQMRGGPGEGSLPPPVYVVRRGQQFGPNPGICLQIECWRAAHCITHSLSQENSIREDSVSCFKADVAIYKLISQFDKRIPTEKISRWPRILQCLQISHRIPVFKVLNGKRCPSSCENFAWSHFWNI